VLERRGDARFPLEPLDECRIERECTRKDLDGDVTFERTLAGAKDDRHSAATELFQNVVFVRQGCPNKSRIVGLGGSNVVHTCRRPLIEPARGARRRPVGNQGAATCASRMGIPGFDRFRHLGFGRGTSLREGSGFSEVTRQRGGLSRRFVGGRL
jgi:hypothetical protein